ncbi:MAG TPA: potassium-transporting ATPase subunit KdpC [Victivallales bacterium]|nr:potassium-transporting ATPase subunit KdpC [Victivallales bacterium]
MKNQFLKQIVNSIAILIVLTVILGIIYPFIVMGLGQLFFSHQANGSLITQDGKIIGSSLVQQKFTSEKYFHGRPAIVDYTDTPTSKVLLQRIKNRIKTDQKQDMHRGEYVPIDLITDSGSGVDPDITPAAAFFQAKRIASENNIPVNNINILINGNIKGRVWGIFGQKTVNVLKLNLALNSYIKTHKSNSSW